MKILAIIGSPRKMGNTYRVVEQIKDNLMGLDSSIEFDYLFVKDCNLQMCTGCFACIAKGEDKCPLKDDRELIYHKMLEADGIVLAAPSYAMGVPGIMKNFIDRFAYTLHRPCFFDKAFLAVTTAGGIIGMKQTLDQLAILSAGGRAVTRLGLSMPPIPMVGLDKKKERGTKKAAKAFFRSLQRQQRKLPGLGDWAYFHSFNTLASYESYRKTCPADYSYYKTKEEYFYPLSGHYLRRLIGKILQGIMKTSLRFMIIKE